MSESEEQRDLHDDVGAVVTSLARLIETLDELSRDRVIHAAEPWTADSDAACLDESDGEGVPPGLSYLLEVDLVHEVAKVWSSWRGGRRPTPEELTKAVLHYAEHDAYLPVSGALDLGIGP